MRPDDFAEKLKLVLKTLVLSRTGLASAINVDKSLVGRWASGAVIPSEHNLAHLTRFVAERIDGFTMLDWDRDLPEFTSALGARRLGRGTAGVSGAIAMDAHFLARGSDARRATPRVEL